MKTATYILVALFVCAALAHGQVPELINYQGRLVDSTNLVNASVELVFRLFVTDVGGTPTYQETQTVAVVDGLYAAMIGASNPAPGSLRTALETDPVYLEIAVDGSTMSPRERMTAVGYAMTSMNADYLGGKCATQFVQSIRAGGAECRSHVTLQGMDSIGVTAVGTNIYIFPKSVATGTPVYVEQDPIYTFDRLSGVLATGTPVYTETDPVWTSASNLYYLQSEADAKFATGMPLYAFTETDPIYTNDLASGMFATGTPLYVFNEQDPIWTNALRLGYTVQGPVTNLSALHLEYASDFKILRGPSRLAIGTNARAYSTRYSTIAIGDAATARYRDGGVAIGYHSDGDYNGVSIGLHSDGQYTNIAIGYKANAFSGYDRIAIGCTLTNRRNRTCAVRGSLYLDGGTGVMYRSSFGSGSWRAKAFTIDHPLDPENKVLRHFCIEGPEVRNVYAGNVQLENGRATVTLPDYYTALNLVGSEFYSLTAVGAPATLWVEEEVADNQFVIAGSHDIKVSWSIKVLRDDPGCLADLRQRPVEQLKSEIVQ